jgi:hypothetical protein
MYPFKIFISFILFIVLFSLFHDARATIRRISHGQNSLGNYFYIIVLSIGMIFIFIHWIEFIGIYDFNFIKGFYEI